MGTLKLEVGKTYRNRKGEEVKILRKGNKGWDYWEGSNGEWYYESGKWSYVTKEHPDDLIEEVTSETTRHTFKIPDDVKEVTVEKVGNKIVIEMIQKEAKELKPGGSEFKEGDIVFEDGRIMIIKMYPNLYHAMFYASHLGLHINGEYGIPFTSAEFRLATALEAQLLFDALKKAGKRWNPETMQVEDVPKIDHIREWVEKHLNCRYYSHEGLTKVIYDYLKHREGEK